MASSSVGTVSGQDLFLEDLEALGNAIGCDFLEEVDASAFSLVVTKP